MSAGATLHDLERRLRLQQDIEAIETLKARYWRAVDRKRPQDVEACLTVDATIDFEGLPCFASRDSFMTVVRQEAAKQTTYHMHHGQNPHITLSGPDVAQGEWDIFYFGIDIAASTLVQMAGVYNDTYVRQAGEWRIASTKMRSTSLQVRALGKME